MSATVGSMSKKKSIDWQLAPAPESRDHITLNSKYDLYGGRWVKP